MRTVGTVIPGTPNTSDTYVPPTLRQLRADLFQEVDGGAFQFKLLEIGDVGLVHSRVDVLVEVDVAESSCLPFLKGAPDLRRFIHQSQCVTR